MTLFQRYSFRQALWPFLGAMTALAGLAVLTQSLSNLDLVSERGETTFVLIYVTLLAMPQVLALLTPIALFLGVAAALNRLSSDSELTVAAAAGMSRFQRVSPFLRLAIYVTLANLVINLFVQPASFREMREQLFEIRTDIAARLLREGEFVRLGDQVSFYVREITDETILNDVFIEDGRGETSAAYAARRGRVMDTERGPIMLMEDGVRTSIDQYGVLTSISFDQSDFELTMFVDSTNSLLFKESDKYLPELLVPTVADLVQGNKERLLAEGHYRLATPLYNLTFALIALAAFMAGEHRRVGYTKNLIFAGAAAIILRLVGFAVQAAAESDDALNSVQYILPVAGGLVALFVIFRPRRRAPIQTSPALAVTEA